MAPFWTVNSYGYPNPFGGAKARQAWETLLHYQRFRDYAALKRFWEGAKAPRKLSSHAVESWKAAFEQFGLLWVPSRSNELRFTPAGEQFVAAGSEERVEDFNWIGLQLLLRYPLRGVPTRRPRNDAHETSDLLLYAFVLAAMLDLGGELWWPELARVLCQVFTTADGPDAVQRIAQLRAGEIEPGDLPLPVANEAGAFYNSLNQVVVQSGLNYQLMERNRDHPPYGDTDEQQVRFWLSGSGRRLVERALGGVPDECAGSLPLWTERLPRAPGPFTDEEAHFAYLGAEVSLDQADPVHQRPPRAQVAGAETWILRVGHDVTIVEGEVHGATAALCALAVGDRVVLTSNRSTTFLISDKQRSGSEVMVVLKPAKPIIDWGPIEAALEGAHGERR